jgi:uncharacterized protein
MQFKIEAVRHESPDVEIFYYDNQTNTLTNSQGDVYEYPQEGLPTPLFEGKALSFSKDVPLRKSRLVTKIKIQMGLSCNYSCDYCSQKFVERAPETSRKDIDDFLEKLNNLDFSEEQGLEVEFWGGEPLVYWKTLKPLAEEITEKFGEWVTPPKFSIITNGSLLNEEICAWLYYMGFSVSISHDGPGQYLRGPDPFDDEVKKQTILDFYSLMRPLGRISINAMLTAKNYKREEIHQWFVELTGDRDVILGEGGLVDAYDEDGYSSALQTKAEHFTFRMQAVKDLLETDGDIGFVGILQKIDTFCSSVLLHTKADTLVQKCGMDNPNTLAVDLRGNVITCQNVSPVQISHNGESHLAGTIEDIESVEIKTSTHWTNRANCADCPVLHICKGSCMFLDGKYWDISCNNAYSDAISIFAVAFWRLTNGFIPIRIESPNLPLDRQDIFGNYFPHEEEPARKVIPIKVVSEKNKVVNDIEVYDKSKIEESL